MSKITVFTNLTLDGVMQAPGRPDEDTRGSFKHGGWANFTLLKGDATKAISKLKQDKDLLIFGSGVLVQSLMRANLIDQYVLLIHPLILGSGHKLFPDGSPFAALNLRDTKPTSRGVMIATYQPANNS